MNQRFQYCTELQEQLSEANNKISRAVLEQAILSTKVWTLEKELKKLKGKMTRSDKENQVLQRCWKRELLQAKNRGGEGQDTETTTNLSHSSLSFEPQSTSRHCKNKTPQVIDACWSINKHVSSHCNAGFPSMLLKKASGTDGASVFTIHSLREQLKQSTWRASQLEQEKTAEIKKLQTLRRLYQIPTISAGSSSLKATKKAESHENATVRIIQSIQDCPSVTEDQTDEWNQAPNPPGCSDETDLQQKNTPSHFPDGLFRAELVDICCCDALEEQALQTTDDYNNDSL